jgi:hypothetical protein
MAFVRFLDSHHESFSALNATLHAGCWQDFRTDTSIYMSSSRAFLSRSKSAELMQ